MTQIERAQTGELTEELNKVAADEGLSPEILRSRVAAGQIVIPSNLNRKSRIIGIGKGLRTKINASIGTSTNDTLRGMFEKDMLGTDKE